MGTKHKKTFGAVRQLPSGRYQARYSVNGIDRKAPSTFETEDEADQWLKKLHEDKQNGNWDASAGGDRTFNEWADRWMNLPLKRRKKTDEGTTSKKAYKTTQGYEGVLRLHVRPFLGDIPIDEIDLATIVRFQDDCEMRLEEKRRTNEQAQDYCRWVMSWAQRKGAIRVSPWEDDEIVMPDGSIRREPVPLEEADIERLVAAIHPHFRLIPTFTAYSGLRSGEVWALRRRSVNPLKHEIEVSHSVGEQKGKGLIVGPTKSGKTRWIRLPDFLFEMVMEHMDATGGGPDDWLFTTRRGGMQVRQTNFMKDVWQPAKLKAELPKRLRFHDLRHYCAHFHISSGFDAYDIKELLGHSSIDITMDIYGGRFDKRREELANRVDEVWRANRASRAANVPDDLARTGKVLSIETAGNQAKWHASGTG